MKLSRLWISRFFLSLFVVSLGCNSEDDWEARQGDPDLEAIARKLEARAESLSIQETVSSLAYLQGLQPIRVVGYGIVVGLGEKGSSECPPDIRSRLVQEMRKRHHLGLESRGLRELHPNELLEDLDTAVVRVSADIPGGALRRTVMDAAVTALTGTQTRSLRGGYLWRCDLKRFRADGAATVVQGKTLAAAEGPVFISAFDDEGELLADVNPRVGSLLGGARVNVDREIRLEIREPSFQTATLVARKINERFPESKKVADATSPGMVKLSIPQRYRGRESEFLALLMHVSLRESSGFVEERTRDLCEEIFDPDAPHDDIGLAWEAIGKGTLPEVRKLYGDRRAYVNYHAARTGLRMNDVDAVLVMRRHAYDLQSPFQQDAIQELGRAEKLTDAAAVLRPLLNHDDDRLRIQAYLALRRRMDRFIRPIRVGEPNFVIDRVRSTGAPLIYARTTGAQRLAIFGDQALCRPPLFYEHPDRIFGLHARPNADKITVLRIGPDGSMLSAPIEAPLEVGGLAEKMGSELGTRRNEDWAGANLPYSEVIKALFDLSRSGDINAEFEVETTKDRVGRGPLEPPGRPESDLED